MSAAGVRSRLPPAVVLAVFWHPSKVVEHGGDALSGLGIEPHDWRFDFALHLCVAGREAEHVHGDLQQGRSLGRSLPGGALRALSINGSRYSFVRAAAPRAEA